MKNVIPLKNSCLIFNYCSLFKHFFYQRILSSSAAALIFCSPALSNGLGENKPWQFATPSEKNVNHNILNLRELKKNGFFDQFSPPNGGGTPQKPNKPGFGDGFVNTVNGDQINCVILSVSSGNKTLNTLSGVTGTLTGIDESNILADSKGSSSQSSADRDKAYNTTTQDNSGNQDASVSGSNIKSNVGSFSGGGTTDQDLDNAQTLTDSPVTASVDHSTACDGVNVKPSRSK